MRARARFDEANALAGARKEGRLEGQREGELIGERSGELKSTMNVARKMKAEGIDTDTVIRITGLTIDDIMRL